MMMFCNSYVQRDGTSNTFKKFVGIRISFRVLWYLKQPALTDEPLSGHMKFHRSGCDDLPKRLQKAMKLRQTRKPNGDAVRPDRGA